jgi:NAD(P)-dependent dehydrogenase (short-subunit alcohol dehydrogenase family)
VESVSVDPVSGLLTGRVVLVAGVGPGLGQALALRCARAGARVVLAARTESRLQTLAARITEDGGEALSVRTDLTDEASTAHLVDVAVETFGRLDTVVGNAFVMPPLADLLDTDLDAVRTSVETNVLAALRLTRLCAQALVATSGSVVLVNSAVLYHSRRTFGAYKMTKAALLAAAQSLASELGPKGVRVNSVAPGYIWADSLKWYFGYLAEQRGVTTQQVYDETAATVDLRKLPEPDEIADAVVFLASDLARAITGHCLDVNGGEYHH